VVGLKFTVNTKLPFEIVKLVARRPMDDVDDEGAEVSLSETLIVCPIPLSFLLILLLSLSLLLFISLKPRLCKNTSFVSNTAFQVMNEVVHVIFHANQRDKSY
jgi:hypothetical protein